MRYCFYVIFGVIFGLCLNIQAAVPNVIVTIKPIHSLVSGVMKGIGTPRVLMSGEKSPHSQSLTPGEVHQIHSADVVIWIGPSYEASLKPIIGLKKDGCRVITLTEEPDMKIYEVRQGSLWGKHTHIHDHNTEEAENEQDDTEDFLVDGHLWLDPDNAKTIVTIVAKEFAALDPQHEEDYLANSQKVINRLEDLKLKLLKLLIPVVGKPYVLYHHDGTQYFDRAMGTKAVGVLMGDSHHGIKARHFLEVRKYIQKQKITCVFIEPQFPWRNFQDLIQKTGAQIEPLDYLGANLPIGEDAYFLMMENFARSFLKGFKVAV